MRARALVGLLLGTLALLTSGCIGIPEEGPITPAETGVELGDPLGYYNDPRPPTPGDTPAGIVKGFLDAQAAIPIQTNTAEEYLTSDGAESWRHSRIVTYTTASLPQGSNQVSVELDGANQIDARGAWLGPLPTDEQELTFTMRREDGEWRIADPPDVLVVPEQWFDQAYRRVALYYLDPTGEILVPEPVFVPRGDQLASSLVDAMLKPPIARLREVERTAIPPGLEVDLSVTADDEGYAQVNLTGGAAMPTEQDASLMVSQIARTLAQDSTLAGFRLTLDGEPVVVGGETTFSIDRAAPLDPAGNQATSLLFGLRDGRLVLGAPGDFELAGGPLGAPDAGLRSVAATLSGTRVAGVTEAGSTVVVSDVRSPDADVIPVATGTDLLPPAYDFAERLWLVDRTAEGAEISVVRDGRQREVEVPGITGRNVTRFLVSRDGSRMVVVLDRPRGDRVLVSRLSYDARGRVLGASRARELAWDDQPRLSVLDIGWQSPTSIVVAHRITGDLFYVRTMSVDGAPPGIASIAATVPERPRSLVTSPRTTDPVLVQTRAGLYDVLRTAEVTAPDPALTYLTYVGG